MRPKTISNKGSAENRLKLVKAKSEGSTGNTEIKGVQRRWGGKFPPIAVISTEENFLKSSEPNPEVENQKVSKRRNLKTLPFGKGSLDSKNTPREKGGKRSVQ